MILPNPNSNQKLPEGIMIYNKKSFARTLGISIETIDRYRKAGKLPHHKIGDRVIFTESDLLAFLDICAIPATNIPSVRERLEMAKATGGMT
jgi:DNA-binding transcriptional MerR regulator